MGSHYLVKAKGTGKVPGMIIIKPFIRTLAMQRQSLSVLLPNQTGA
jgi:hypothetical protein